MTHRDNNSISRRSLVESILKKSSVVDLRNFEDRRAWHPQFIRPANSFSSSRHRLVQINYKRPSKIQRAKPVNFMKLAFENSQGTLICVRRKIRREVLHAKRKTGRRGQKRKIFNYFSSITCKRRK